MLKAFYAEKIIVNERQLYVRHSFEGKPDPKRSTVILVHGFTDSGYYWSRLAADLEPDCNVIMPDMLGHGQSERLSGVTTVESYAADVVAILDYYGIAQAGIGGHSMGGIVACVAPARNPGRFTHVMLEDPAWSNHPSPTGPIGTDFLIQYDPVKAWRDDAVAMRAMTRPEIDAKVQAEQPNWHPDDWEMYISDRLQYDLAIFEQVDFAVRAHWRADLALIAGPVLLVTGEEALGGIVGDAFAQEIMDIAQRGEVAKIMGTGHGIHRQNYPAFRDVVVPFFTST